MTELDRRILEQALAASRDGIIVTDAHGGDQPVIFVNPAFQVLTGYSERDALGRNCRFLQAHDRDQDALDDVRLALEQGSPVEVVVRNYRKDGSMFWNQLRLAPVADGASDTPAQWVGILHPLKDPSAHLRQGLDTGRQQAVVDELRDIVRIDRTTGIYNRAWFDELFARDWAIARRDRQSMTVMIFDVDFFSDYNETFGRQASDSCLRLIARAIQGSLRRAGDLSARYGGEEFIGSARGMDERKARALAESICEKVESLCMHHPKSSISKYVTVSIGVATTVPRHDQEPAQAVGFAYDALLEAKAAGRDRVVSVVR
ncbi:MAG TPA: diguanylate cyclase [Gammaproteobacteria bacterium]|nr:diguanylate cyclase [Gammaproteobacteria bacterium]